MESTHQLTGNLTAKASGNSLVIEGFANKAVVDRGKDLVDPQAFVKDNGLDNFMKNPVILFDHGMDLNMGNMPIGKAIEVTAKDDGLFIKAKISQAKDAPISTIRSLIEEGMLRAFSIGFSPKEMEPDEEKGINVIKSAELFEVSIVGIPMNQDSLFSVQTKSGKKVLQKRFGQIAATICKEKGADYAARVQEGIDRMEQKGLNRSDILRNIADECGGAESALKDVLSGNLIDVPNQIKNGISAVLGSELHKIIDIKQKNNDPDNDGGAANTTKTFEEFVSEKIKELIDEGKSIDDSVAEAILAGREVYGSEQSPNRDMYEKFFGLADDAAVVFAERLKQAEQEGVDEPTEPIKTGTDDSELGASPMLDQVKQTNILLSTMINQMKTQQDAMAGVLSEFTLAIGKLISVLDKGGDTQEEPKPEPKPEDEDEDEDEPKTDDEIGKRLAKSKRYLELLNQRLEKLGA